LQARLFDAEQICQGALRRFTDSVPESADWYWTLARVAYQRNDLADSRHLIDRAIELSAAAQVHTLHSRALLQRALIQNAIGKKKLAQADLDAADQLARGLQDQVILRAVIRQRALFAVEDGDLSAARQWLDLLTRYGVGPFPFYYSFARGRVFLAEDRSAEAKTEFELALNSLETADFALVRTEVLVWQAVCLGALGAPVEAAFALERAVRQSQMERVVRPFIEAQAPLLDLISKIGRSRFAWLVEILGSASGPQTPALTPRESEILQLLSMGMSNHEMAEKLVIAEGTLKRHIANLYQKLGVHNRAQAVRHFNQQ
jgi:LuxR family transcriptional regulator, maltose regulon positive regulatory protein